MQRPIYASILKWNVSVQTVTSGAGLDGGNMLRVFKKTLENKSDYCETCEGRIFDTAEEAEQHAFDHGHLKIVGYS